MKQKRLHGLTACLSAIFILTGCDSPLEQAGDIVSGVENAWDSSQEAIELRAYSVVEGLEAEPSHLGKNYKADWNSTFDDFTLTYSIDRSSRAAISLFLGDFGEGLNEIDSYTRSMMDEDAVKRSISKDFNDNWYSLFVSLMALDGMFSYVVETDSWVDNSFNFDSDDIYELLKDKGYFESQ